MHPLFQRLKELDWDTFQRLCFQVIKARHPGLEIRHVEGAGGDRGLDLFLGELTGNPTIWQCKHFPNGLGPKQRPQVKDSLKAALEYFQPQNWVLAIPVDLDRKAHEWFQKIKRAYSDRVAIGLFQASDIIRELIYRRSIREAFFPGAVLDSVLVRRSLAGIGASLPNEIDTFKEHELAELIARLEEADARFTYQIVYGPNSGPEILEAAPVNNPLHVASVYSDNKRVDVFARDLEALRLDPVSVNLILRDGSQEKIREFLRTGKPQELTPDEVVSVRSSLDFLLPDTGVAVRRVFLKPGESLKQRRVPLRLTFRNGGVERQYEYVEFRVERAGQEEVEIVSVSSLPFVASFTMPLVPNRNGAITLQRRFVGAEARSVAAALDAFALISGGSIELYDLRNSKVLAKVAVSEWNTTFSEELDQLIRDAARVGEEFGSHFHVPKELRTEDLNSIALLIAILDKKIVPVNGMRANLAKSREHEAVVRSALGQKMQILAQFPYLSPKPVIFGSEIDTGPVQLHAQDAEIAEAKEFEKKYSAAKYGTAVPIHFKTTEVLVSRIKHPDKALFIKKMD